MNRTLIIISAIAMALTAPAAAPKQNGGVYKPYIPLNKGLDADWIASLRERGARKVYSGKELELIGMPCGGIGAGQLEISGSGELGTWWIFNEPPKPNGGLGYANGARYLNPAPIEKVVESGFAMRVQPKGKPANVFQLNRDAFPDMEFVGEYPIAHFDYKSTNKGLPVQVTSKVFSPFVPLNVRASANPVTILHFTVANTSKKEVAVDLGGWLENASGTTSDVRYNEVFGGENLTGVMLGLENSGAEKVEQVIRETIVFDRFEADGFNEQWTTEEDAFGSGPLAVADTKFHQPIEKFEGNRIATSFHREGTENLHGKLVSRSFKISRSYIQFRIGGGNHAGKTCINLIIGGNIVRTAQGNNSNTFKTKTWDVSEYEGKLARLEIIDQQQGPWAFVMVDDILFLDKAEGSENKYAQGHPRHGNMSISVMDGNAVANAGWSSVKEFLNQLSTRDMEAVPSRQLSSRNMGGGALVSSFTLKPGEQHDVTFLISWYFPHLYNNHAGGHVGNLYNNWYTSSEDVADWVSRNFDELYEQTELFRATYHDTTLPYWLANRISMPLSTLACDNVKIHENGRMYAFEGVSFCEGTCGHVYNFVPTIACLFPELERSVRMMQDFDERFGFDPKTGRINFRGWAGPDPTAYCNFATDAQSGYVLKTYREHLHSTDMEFLKKAWPMAKLAMNYQIFRDGGGRAHQPNGVLEGKQTFWDPMWWGPNPYNNTLYLAALRAAEEMALLMDEDLLAYRYRKLFESGSAWMREHMWNGEYYVHLYPEGTWSHSWNGVIPVKEEQQNAEAYVNAFGTRSNHYYVATACDAQQLFGQNWANQLGLGDILPPEHCRSAAAAIFKYNWTPDIQLVYDLYPPKNRTLAAPGEGAMVNAAWPKEERQSFENTHDKDDIWSGLEYEAACDMINAGLIDDALIMIRAIHDRYDGIKRNPWNEIEGAEHYSRAMQSWNVLLSLSGFTCDGPAGKIGFAPKLTPENFKSFFAGVGGWGTFEQTRTLTTQDNTIEVKYGTLSINTIELNRAEKHEVKTVNVTLNGQAIPCKFSQVGRSVRIKLKGKPTLSTGQKIKIEMR